MNDNTTPHLANEYNSKIKNTIPYYQEFHMQAIDVVTAIQVHHYLQEDERERATRNVFRALKQDGIFISFENVIPNDSEMVEFELERWKRYQVANGKSEEDATAHIRRCGINYFPITVAITAHFKPMVFDRVEYIEKNVVEALTDR